MRATRRATSRGQRMAETLPPQPASAAPVWRDGRLRALVRVVRAHVRGATRQARAGPGHRPRTLAAGRLGGLGLGLVRDPGLLVLLGAEDLLLGGAIEELGELLRVDGLALQEDLRDRIERRTPLDQEVLGRLVRFLDDAADLVVDLAGDLVRVVRLRGELPSEEGLRAVVPEDAGTEALGH